MAEDVITNVIDFLERIRKEDIVTVRFRKKDGSVRVMRCTLNFERIPKPDHPKSVDLPKILKLISKSKILHVYDLDKKEWRSVPFETTEWLETPEMKYYIKK